MAERIYPQEYFSNGDAYRKGVIMGAILILIGVIVGGAMVYFAKR